MNGPQDLGGRQGFGPINPDPDEPQFHANWEKRALGITLACGVLGYWTLDEGRHARESLHPADYYRSTYYEIWTKALEILLVRHGEVTQEELAQKRVLQTGHAVNKKLHADKVAAVLARGGPTQRELDTPTRFKSGDRVCTINKHTTGHTRLPDYARDKQGVIETVRGGYVYPDTNAHGQGEHPQYLYTVRFTGTTLWGENADPTLTVSIDAWESYLEPA